MTNQNSPNKWFKLWHDIIEEKKEVTRVDLADLSGCSLWTLKALTRDFITRESYIIYKHGKFTYWTPRIELTLCTLSETDRNDLK